MKSMACNAYFIHTCNMTLAIKATTSEGTTAKFSTLLAARYAGNILSLLVQGHLLRVSNYAYCYLIAVGTYLLLIILILKYIPESFDFGFAKSMSNLYTGVIKILCRQPGGRGNLLDLWIVMMVIFLHKSIAASQYAITVLYIHRNISTFSNSAFYWYWIAVKSRYFLIVTIGKWWLERIGLSNSTMAVFAAFSCSVQFSILSVTHSELMLYVSTVIGSFSTLLYPICQSFISQLFLNHDIRRAYSVFFCLDYVANIDQSCPLVVDLGIDLLDDLVDNLVDWDLRDGLEL